ncbi:MAG: zinc transporter ZupT [Rikenellaceae bacterium]|nr:zinc transporter ZupT [Rikenellaceae bacterium]
MEMQHFILPFLLTLGAGLATGIGSVIAFVAKSTNRRLLSFSLGLSGGVMIYVSFAELMPQGAELLTGAIAGKGAEWINLAAFFGGMALIGLIDHLVPSFENPHEAHRVEELQERPKQMKLMRVGLMSALAIAIHNFPEGIATFTAGLNDPTLGLAIALAVAIHNIPEGIAVSVPIFYATESRRKAFLWSLISGLAEPLGALVAWLVLAPLLTDTLLGCVLTGVAGIMVYISLDELLPAAREYGEAHTSILGVVVGMAIMAVSLLML